VTGVKGKWIGKLHPHVEKGKVMGKSEKYQKVKEKGWRKKQENRLRPSDEGWKKMCTKQER